MSDTAPEAAPDEATPEPAEPEAEPTHTTVSAASDFGPPVVDDEDVQTGGLPPHATEHVLKGVERPTAGATVRLNDEDGPPEHGKTVGVITEFPEHLGLARYDVAIAQGGQVVMQQKWHGSAHQSGKEHRFVLDGPGWDPTLPAHARFQVETWGNVLGMLDFDIPAKAAEEAQA